MSISSLFDADDRKRMGDLYGRRPIPTRERYAEQLREWMRIADKHHTTEEIAAIEADQAKRIEAMK